jgi:hypothetical protein
MVSQAERRLLGLPVHTLAETMQHADAQTPQTMRQDLSDVLPSLLMVGPSSLTEPPAGLSEAPVSSTSRVSGDTYVPVPDREQGSLVVGDDGVSWCSDEGKCHTVRWHEVAVALRWDNGLRRLVGEDGHSVAVAPWNWRSAAHLTAEVDARVDERLRVRIGPGDTQFQREVDGEQRSYDLWWIATLIGMRLQGGRVDVVLYVDGMLILEGSGVPVADRLAELRSQTRATICKASPWWRFIAEREVGAIICSRRPRLLGGDRGVRVDVLLRSDEEVRLTGAETHLQRLRTEAPKVFGDRFRAR